MEPVLGRAGWVMEVVGGVVMATRGGVLVVIGRELVVTGGADGGAADVVGAVGI